MIPEGWQGCKLGEISSVNMGQSPPSSSYNIENEGLPFLQGNADFGSRYPSIKTWCREPARIAAEGSILISVRAPVGEINIANNSICIGRGLASINAIKADQEFLYQYLQNIRQALEKLAQGSTFSAISGSQLKELSLILPPLPEQRKIAAVLSSVDRCIETTEAMIAKLKDLKKALMQELLTKGLPPEVAAKYGIKKSGKFKDSPLGKIPEEWNASKVGKLCKVLYGKSPISVKDQYGKFPVYGTSGISAWANKFMYDGETILIGRKGTLDNPIFIRGKIWVIDTAFYTTFKKNCYPKWLYYSLLRINLNRYSEFTSIPSLTRETIENIELLLPTLPEQSEIAAILSSLDMLIENKKEKENKLNSLKKALMQDLLTGKVRVKVDDVA